MTTYNVDLVITGQLAGTIKGTISSDDVVTTPPPDEIEPPPEEIEPPPAATQPPAIPPIPEGAVWCGPNRAVLEPADAVSLVPTGGTLVIEDGRYVKPFFTDKTGITIRSASGNPYACYLDGQGGYGGGHKLSWGKGMVHTSKT